jgi:hypothetical protein
MGPNAIGTLKVEVACTTIVLSPPIVVPPLDAPSPEDTVVTFAGLVA